MNRNFLLSIIVIIFSFILSQETCEYPCLAGDALNDVINDMKKLEYKDSTNTIIISNLEDQIKLYILQSENDSTLMKLYDKKLKLYDGLIKEVKPKWYDNKYLWFFFGVAITATSVKLAGEITD